ncbi:MAG TPA: DUF2341 domain-containing protein, partial [Nannocystaceae bacterium]|nr:DUF2341 domain-containing protein [Nannocystaceae bacterium]
MGVRAFALGSAMTLAGCGPAATFVCSADEDCRDGDRVGTCEADHYCSFPDDGCPSRRRYGERAPSDLAGECVGGEATSTGATSEAGETGSGAETTGGPATSESTSSSPTTSSSGSDSGPIPTQWWDDAWSHRVEITATFDGSTDELVGVPLLAVLTAERFDAAAASADGRDLRFVAADGTVLAHQIDTWDAAGSPLVWFRMPAITGNDALFLYYGNPAATDVATADVWGSEHVAVLHMGAAIVDASGS